MSELSQKAPPGLGAALRWDTLRRGDVPLRVITALIALILPNLLILLSGQDLFAVYRELLTGITLNRLGDATMYAAILLFCTASAMLTFNAALWNIGIEGQLAIATIASTAVVLAFRSAPAIILIPMTLLAGAIAGGLWSFLVAAFKLRGVHEIFSGFALNQVAGALVKWMLLDIWGAISLRRLSGIPIPDNAGFPATGPLNVWVIGVSLVVLIGVTFALARTPIGLRIRAVGLSRVAAGYYGISANRMFFLTLMASGAIAGLAGVITSTTYFHRFQPDITSGFGFTAILIYLIVRTNWPGAVILCLLFGLINAGTVGLQIRLGIDTSLADVIRYSIILALYLLRRPEGNS